MKLLKKNGMKRISVETILTIPLIIFLIVGMFVATAVADFPEKPMKMIVPYKPGGSTDTLARVYARGLAEIVGQPVIVENRGGAGGGVGAMYLKGQSPDGYTLMISFEGTPTWNPIHDKVAYTVDDFTYLGAISEYQQALICMQDKPYKSMEELIAYSKEHQGMTFADQGTIVKILFLYVAKQEGLDWRAVPTKGGGGMIPMLMSGTVDFAYSGGVHQKYGDKIRVLASTNATRLEQNPDVPALVDKYGVYMPSMIMIMGPKGIPDTVAAYLETAIEKATKNPNFTKLMNENLKFPIKFRSSEEVKKILPHTIKKLKEMKEKMGL